MAQYKTGTKARLKRQRTEQAIALAMQGRWEEAVEVNRDIIEVFPTDVDAHNRLGKALTELGRYDGARASYERALENDPNSTIAQRNLARLSHLKEGQFMISEGHPKLGPHVFVEESGKTCLTELHQPAPREVLARMTSGDQVYLRVGSNGLIVENVRGEYLGRLEHKLEMRLMKLMEGGNRYSSAIASITGSDGKVIIRETFRHPSQAGRASFPSREADGFRSYVKESLIRYGLEEEEGSEEVDDNSDWEEESEEDVHEGFSLIEDLGGAVLDHDQDEV